MGRLQKKKDPARKKKKNGEVAFQDGDAKKTSLTVVGNSVKSSFPASQKKNPNPGKSVPGHMGRAISKSSQFLREVKAELKKVTWPSRKQTVGSTAVVIVLVMIISLFLGVVDIGLSNLIRVVF